MPLLFHSENYDNCMLSDDPLYCSFTYEISPLDPSNVTDLWRNIEVSEIFHVLLL